MTTQIWKLKSAVFVFCLTMSGTAYAQQRPLVTEDPETIGTGRVLLEGGFSMDFDQANYVNGLEGDITRFGSFGISIGVGTVAEVQVDGGIVQRLEVIQRLPNAPLENVTLFLPGDKATSFEDLIVATKVRVASETASRPAIGLRFGTKLPTAAPDKGIGLGTTDFLASFLLAKTVRSVRTVGNAGLIVLGNPLDAQQSASTFGFGLSVARAITNAFELVGEINGRLSPPFEDDVPEGLKSRGVMRFAGRYTYAMLRLDFGVLVGITTRDPSFGFSAGATYVITR